MIVYVAKEPDIPQDTDPVGERRVWRWVAPTGLAVAVVAVVAGVQLATDGTDGPERAPSATHRAGPEHARPRFSLWVGDAGGTSAPGRRAPLVQVRAIAQDGRERLVDSVRPPSPATWGREIVAGPGGTFVVTAARARPCESRLYRFRITRDGHVTGIAPLRGGTVPALVAGLAISPDGRRIAYATAPCATTPPPGAPPAAFPPQAATPPKAALTVLNVATGRSRTWTAAKTSIVGEVVWARDNHTLGYTIADVVRQAPGTPSIATPGTTDWPRGDTVGDVTLYALNTAAAGDWLPSGRVLLRPPGSGTITSAVMGLDGRTGYGEMSKERPASTSTPSAA